MIISGPLSPFGFPARYVLNRVSAQRCWILCSRPPPATPPPLTAIFFIDLEFSPSFSVETRPRFPPDIGRYALILSLSFRFFFFSPFFLCQRSIKPCFLSISVVINTTRLGRDVIVTPSLSQVAAGIVVQLRAIVDPLVCLFRSPLARLTGFIVRVINPVLCGAVGAPISRASWGIAAAVLLSVRLAPCDFYLIRITFSFTAIAI